MNITLTNYETCKQTLDNYVEDKNTKKEKFCDSMPYGILDQNICGRGSPLCSLVSKPVVNDCSSLPEELPLGDIIYKI